MRRKLHTIKIKDENSMSQYFECEWNFEKQTTRMSNNAYFIWNVMYEEPLYAISYFYKSHELKRNVYLWHKNQIQSSSSGKLIVSVGTLYSIEIFHS
jgi:hypothetical protein